MSTRKTRKLRISFLRIGSLIVLLLVFPLLAAWIYLAQPSFSRNQLSRVQADPKKLEEYVRRLSVDFFPRSFDRTDHLDASADYIAETFARAGARTERQFFEVAGVRYQNVLARFGGDSSKPRWIIGAHYDSCGHTPGADDNASGVAGLMELARLFGNMSQPPPVELVAYTLEEPPFFRTSDMGSAHHAKAAAASGLPIRVVIILEMIGYFDDQPGSQEYPIRLLNLLYPDQGNFLILVGNLEQRRFTRDVKTGMQGSSSLPIYSINAPASLRGIDFSDHLNYWAHGLPAVMLTDTAFYRNRAYHGPGDTWDRLNYAKMADAVVALYSAVLKMEEAPFKPAPSP